MGLLDDLKKEAEEKEALARGEGAAAEAHQAYYEEHLRGIMLRANTFFSELVEHLNTIVPDVGPDYALVPPGKRAPVLKHGPYLMRADDDASPRTIVIRTECKLEQRFEFDVRGAADINRYTVLLDEHKFPYEARQNLDNNHNVVGATFILDGPLTVQIRLTASPEEQCILLDLLNVEPQPVKRYKLSPDRIDDALLDRLGRMLIREESTLVEVKVSDEVREELRRKVEEEKRRQEQEMAEAKAYLEAERQAEEEARLINRAKRSVTDGIKKIFSKD